MFSFGIGLGAVKDK